MFVPASKGSRTTEQKAKKELHKGRESDDNVAIVKSVPQLGCVSQDSKSLESQKGRQSRKKPDAKSLGTNSKSTIHTVYATSSKYPRK